MKLLACYSLWKPVLLTSVCFISLFAAAQRKPTERAADNVRTAVLERMTDTSSVEERLVELALKGPQLKVADNQNNINEYHLQKIRNSWLNLLTISTNYNPVQTSATPYPRYFFGLNLPLGIIFTRGSDVKVARESVELRHNMQEQLVLDIKAQVLSKYRQYQTFTELLLLQNEVVDDEQAAFLQAEEKFRNGTITVDIYNSASKSYNSQKAQKLNLQLQQDLVKIEIEKMIGTSLESVINKNK